MSPKPDFDVRYVFDPVACGDDDRLCSAACRYRAVGRDRWFFGLTRVYAVCQFFERPLEVFADGQLEHKIKRCDQCRNVEKLLVPFDYAEAQREDLPRLPVFRPELKSTEPEDEFEKHLRENGKGHLVDHFNGRGNVTPMRRTHR